MKTLKKIIVEDSAQGLIEYSFIISFVIIAVLGTLTLFGDALIELYETIKIDIF